MRRFPALRATAALLSLSMISMGFTQVTHAGLIGTEHLTTVTERAAQIERLQGLIASEDVQARLIALGVDPDRAAERVASLTDEELARMDREIEQMPAGAGVIEIFGIVFIVLLILELTGTIDIFKKA
jgi:hypothetical protein